ncbi:hypothetical protein KEJ37_03570 [Candidatus Bathyarchaeota archaeon]|nr:hypothetical protein [Candidatus Bathyarchaeota archaeon]
MGKLFCEKCGRVCGAMKTLAKSFPFQMRMEKRRTTILRDTYSQVTAYAS